MALLSTTALPLTLTHAPQPPSPTRGDPHTLLKHMKASAAFTKDQELMIDKFYNAIRQNIQGMALVGLLSDLPTAGHPGRTFFATDTNGFFEDNGTVWTQINATGAGVLFAHLPASPVLGTLAVVTNSNTNTWGANAAGGGAFTVLVWWNGANWTVVGK